MVGFSSNEGAHEVGDPLEARDVFRWMVAAYGKFEVGGDWDVQPDLAVRLAAWRTG